MSYCGEPYAFMLVTASGRTPDDPWGLFAFYEDYLEWSAVAKNVHLELLKRRAAYESAVAQGDADSHPREGEIQRRLSAYEVAFDDLPSRAWYATFAVDHEEHVTNAINVATEGTCLMDMMDEVTEHYTGLVPKTSYRDRDVPLEQGTKIALAVGGAAFVGTAIGVAVWSIKKRLAAPGAKKAHAKRRLTTQK